MRLTKQIVRYRSLVFVFNCFCIYFLQIAVFKGSIERKAAINVGGKYVGKGLFDWDRLVHLSTYITGHLLCYFKRRHIYYMCMVYTCYCIFITPFLSGLFRA